MTEDQIDQIHEAAQSIIAEGKTHLYPSEVVVMARSQYLNIEAYFQIVKSMVARDVPTWPAIDDKLLGYCQSFFNNIDALPSAVSWMGKEADISRVQEIRKVVLNVKEMRLMYEEFEAAPSTSALIALENSADQLKAAVVLLQ